MRNILQHSFLCSQGVAILYDQNPGLWRRMGTNIGLEVKHHLNWISNTSGFRPALVSNWRNLGKGPGPAGTAAGNAAVGKFLLVTAVLASCEFDYLSFLCWFL